MRELEEGEYEEKSSSWAGHDPEVVRVSKRDVCEGEE